MAKYNKLTGKHVFVIGGSKGIGRGVVEASLEGGALVTISASSKSSADAAVAEIKSAYPSADVLGLHCDLSKDIVESDLAALLTKAAERAPINHIVLTAADHLTLKTLQEIDVAVIQQTAHMRLVVPTILGKLAQKYLAETPESSYTFTTGGIAEHPMPNWSLIAFLGAGLTGLARNLALDLKPIRVNCVMPGFVDTPLWDGMSKEQKEGMINSLKEKYPMGTVGQVEDVAEAYVYLMKDRNATGEIVKTRSGGNLV